MDNLHVDDKHMREAHSSDSASSPRVDAVYGDDDGHGHVKQKFRGTEADRHEMAVMGKKQVLRARAFLSLS
jgi:hypothetical protein